MSKSLSFLHLLTFWYKDSLVFTKRLFKNLLVFLDNKLAVSLMAKKLFVPLFHDTSIVGRILSFLFRLVRAVIGTLIILLVMIVMIFWVIVWLTFPLWWLMFWGKSGVWSLIAIWLVDSAITMNKPSLITEKTDEKKAKNCMTKSLKRKVKKANKENSKLRQELIKDFKVKHMLKRLEIPETSFWQMESWLSYQDWVNLALQEAKENKDKYLTEQHFLLAFLKHENYRFKEAKKVKLWLKRKQSWQKTPFIWSKDYKIRPIGGVNRDWSGMPTPTLDKYSSDLTQMAQKSQLQEILGKEEEVKQVVNVLSRSEKNNVLIVGEAGSGKSTLVKGIAQEIVRGVTEKSLRFKRLVSLQTSKLSAGADEASLKTRVNKIVEEITAAGNIILFVDEVHNWATVNQDEAETSNLFMALEGPLSEGAFQFIGATSTENYKKYIEPNEAFARLLEVVELKPASIEKASLILEYLATKLEPTQDVLVTYLAIDRIVRLAEQLIKERVLPDSAVNLLDEVVVLTKNEGKKIVTSVLVEKLVSQKTKVPVSQLDSQESEKLIKLEQLIHQRVIGQETAVKAVADAMKRARTQIKDPKKPMASFLFAGPTGVGKTETAKALAAEWFGSDRQMVRLDMSEYQNLDSLNRLIGAPPGTAAADEGGQLTEAVRHQPYTLVLLDEIEKAHPKILNLFLQVLDEARLTDSSGRLADFANTIIIATTNVGTKELMEKKPKEAMAKIEAHFPPEWLNRFTAVITFKALTNAEIKQIVQLKLKKLSQRLSQQEIGVEFDNQTTEKLAQLSFSEQWGGRQADRVIEEKVMNVLAEKIIKKQIVKGQTVKFTADWIR